MTVTTAEASPAEDVVASVPAAAATTPVHAKGSTYTCPACREAEDRES